MAVERSFRQILDYVDKAKTWEAEKRVVAERARLASDRRRELQEQIIVAEASRVRRETWQNDRAAYVAKQRAAGMAECPTCERWWPYSEIDAHIRGCNSWPQGS